jgi:PilZ domain
VNNKRKHPRHNVSDVGKIMISKPFSVMDCVVRDLSAGGACLEISGTAELPATFELVFAGKRLRCQIVWQGGRRVGVAFS